MTEQTGITVQVISSVSPEVGVLLSMLTPTGYLAALAAYMPTQPQDDATPPVGAGQVYTNRSGYVVRLPVV